MPAVSRRSLRSSRPLPLLLGALLLAACGGADPVQGTLHVAVQTDPDPPVLGRNAVFVDVTSADGTPLDGLAVEVTPWMPAHGHGSTEQPIVEALGGGRYRAFPVTFFMVGDWQVTARASRGDEFGTSVTTYSIQ